MKTLRFCHLLRNVIKKRHNVTLLNLITTGGLSILLHGVISLSDATSCDKYYYAYFNFVLEALHTCKVARSYISKRSSWTTYRCLPSGVILGHLRVSMFPENNAKQNVCSIRFSCSFIRHSTLNNSKVKS